MRLLRRLAVLTLCVALLLGVGALSRPRVRLVHRPFANVGYSSLTWWIIKTPLCAGPLCVNVFDDHANLEWHWAG